MTELEEALRIDPDCGIANYFLGELCRIEGKTNAAEKYLARASKLMAPDRRRIEDRACEEFPQALLFSMRSFYAEIRFPVRPFALPV